jgi:protein O-GlcNAc transferase
VAPLVRRADRLDAMSGPLDSAVSLRRSGDAAGAALLLQKHLRRYAQDAAAHRLLAVCLCDLAQVDRAVFHAEQAASLAPDAPDALVTLGNARTLAADHTRAAVAYARALKLAPDNANAALGLGASLIHAGRYDEARDVLAPAVNAHPENLPLRRALARTLTESGRVEEAIAEHERTLALFPSDARTLSSLCFALQNSDQTTPAQIERVHRRFGSVVQEHARRLGPLAGFRTPIASEPDRPLRIGFVSPDLRDHSVACFIEPVLASLERSEFAPVCFFTGSNPDDVTQRLAGLCEFHHVPCSAAGAEIPSRAEVALAARIAGARVDVLVDLAGHTGGATLGAFALRPAPVQLTYLGYPDTTGLGMIDARIVDSITDPPGTERDSRCTEKLIRIDRCFLSYKPRADAPDVAEPPAEANGRITFGSFNNIKKLSPTCLGLWARVLGAVPDSRLAIKGRFASSHTRERFLAILAREGVSEDRVELLPYADSAREHLDLYRRLDIALDAFPYHGTTTTCEALWQGVPTVTLAGERHASRVGLSLLASVGLTELVADTPERFVSVAARLASDPGRLRELRATMRQRVAASPLMDAASHARALEREFRALWRAACSPRA